MEGKLRDMIAHEDKVCMALSELNGYLSSWNAIPISVSVMENFALLESPMVIPGDTNCRAKLRDAVEQVGNAYSLPKNWLNDDMAASGKSFNDMEWMTGPLTFRVREQMSHCVVNVIDLYPMMRMRMVELDTILVNDEADGNSELIQSLVDDILAISKHQNLDIKQVRKDNYEWIMAENLWDLLNTDGGEDNAVHM